MTAPYDTLLELFGMGVPLYSARGLSQTLSVIHAADDMRRDINGVLRDISNPQFRKYASKISCTDQRVPAMDGIWPGMELTVHCVAELSYPVSGHAQRPEVSDSSYEESGFIFYRPILIMMVQPFSIHRDEWTVENQWELSLEEV